MPVYGLGHTQLFSMLDKSSALGSFLMRMSRRLKAWNIGGSLEVGGYKYLAKDLATLNWNPTLKIFKMCKQSKEFRFHSF